VGAEGWGAERPWFAAKIAPDGRKTQQKQWSIEEARPQRKASEEAGSGAGAEAVSPVNRKRPGENGANRQ
jgi:hypothetical protein